MSLLQTVSPEEAEGEVKEMYALMQASVGTIPAPMRLASASPALFGMLKASLEYYMKHPTLGFGLLSSIRYLVARQVDFTFCTQFNANFLKMQGMTEEDVAKMVEDPFQAPLEDKDRAMLGFVMKAVKTPDAVEAEDMDGLRQQGWSDSDILDALAHGTNMVASSILMKTFKVDQSC